MTNIDDARDFMVFRGDETEVWYTFLKTKNATSKDDQDLHKAARQAVEIFDQRWAEQATTVDLVEKLVGLYEVHEWEIYEDSLADVQRDAITAELEARHDTSEFFARYAREHKDDDTPVAFSNEVFVKAWTDEILRLRRFQSEAIEELMSFDYDDERERRELWDA